MGAEEQSERGPQHNPNGHGSPPVLVNIIVREREEDEQRQWQSKAEGQDACPAAQAISVHTLPHVGDDHSVEVGDEFAAINGLADEVVERVGSESFVGEVSWLVHES